MNDSTLKGFDRYDRTKTFEAFLEAAVWVLRWWRL